VPGFVTPPQEAYADPSKRTKPAPTKTCDFVRTTLEPKPVASVRVKIPAKEVAQHMAGIYPEAMGQRP
jgi:hypothetical protein